MCVCIIIYQTYGLLYHLEDGPINMTYVTIQLNRILHWLPNSRRKISAVLEGALKVLIEALMSEKIQTFYGTILKLWTYKFDIYENIDLSYCIHGPIGGTISQLSLRVR